MGPSTRSRRLIRDRDTPALVDTTTYRDPIAQEEDDISECVDQDIASPTFVLLAHEKRTFCKNREAVRSVTRSSNFSNNPVSDSTTSDSTKCYGVRGKAKPGSCRPKVGDDPFIMMFDDKGAISDHSHKFAAYCGEEARTYERYPLHLEWDAQQSAHVHAFYEASQHDHYKFIGLNGEEFCEIQAKSTIKKSIQHKKQEYCTEIKYNYFRRWEEADPMITECMLEDIGKLMPRDQWSLLIEYWNSSKKKAQSERDTANRKRPRATPTQGSITIVNKDHKMKKKLGEEYTPAKVWLETHNANDDDTIAFRKKFEDTVEPLNITKDSNLTALCPVLDSVYGKHHGVYERGIRGSL